MLINHVDVYVVFSQLRFNQRQQRESLTMFMQEINLKRKKMVSVEFLKCVIANICFLANIIKKKATVSPVSLFCAININRRFKFSNIKL